MVSITNADLEIYVTENSVTTVIWKDNARVLAFGDVVRITDRDGIRYEFLYTDVIAPTSPAWSSADELADHYSWRRWRWYNYRCDCNGTANIIRRGNTGHFNADDKR
jgi:hypothetical protein